MRVASEHVFTGTTASISSYDSTKTLLGSLIQQRSGATSLDNFAGPMPIAVARPMEQSTTIASAFPSVIAWSSDKHWVFLADNATAAATRRINFYEYTLSTSTFNWKGFITMNFVTNTGNKTIRGFRMVRTTHSSGTVAVSGTGVTGTSTQFTTDRIGAGARIGFGSTDPTQITTWYEISSIASDTSITLSSSAGTIGSGSAYVIEELRAVVAITNATAANGGLFVVKGLNYTTFQTGGTNIAEASTADNIRGIYWLADASTVTNTVAAGLALNSTSSATSHYVWVLDGTTTAKFYKYDIRAALGSLSSGKSTSAFQFATGTSPTLTGTITQVNNGRLATLNHGPGSGVKSIYFATTTRVYRVAESGILTGVTNFLSDSMLEIPPGGTNTYAAGGAMQAVDYSDSIDRLIVMSSGAAGIRSYITQYRTDSGRLDHLFLIDMKQLDQSTADSNSTPVPSINATAVSIWSEVGVFYVCRNGTAATNNLLYALPTGADWQYASSTEQRLITPEISTSNAVKLYRAYVIDKKFYGSDALTIPDDGYRLYYRTSGISDDSGSWVLLTDVNDLSGVTPASSIQFMFEFRTIGFTMLPSRIYAVGVVYEDSSTDSHYIPSVGKSSIASRIFAFRQQTSWGGTIPTLTIRVYNADTSSLVLSDTTSAGVSGTWQYSTDGTTWNSWSAAADTVGNYIRYTASSLPDGINAKVSITQ